MNILNYQSGGNRQASGYTYFLPSLVNQEWELSLELVKLTDHASRFLGELNAYSTLIPNVDLYISMHIAKEAENSSKIEGTKTNIEDVFTEEMNIDPEKRDDWKEVINYIRSTNYAIVELERLPISTRLIKEVHKILLSGVGGNHKNPGEFRKSQNWIGGATISDAHFIPPHHQHINDLMNDLENFIHNKNLLVPDIVKIGIVHYQFETIHPFLDGNGRIGRLLVILFLINSGILSKPVLYLSDYLEKHRSLYYQNLDFVRTQNNLEQWLKFFLVSVIETSKKGIQTFKNILELSQRMENMLATKAGKSLGNANSLLKLLYSQPIVNPQLISSHLEVTTRTAQRLITLFTELKILNEKTGFKRNREYAFSEYINLFVK